NWTKNTPSAQGDILGDWREEIIVRTSDNKYVRVYTTNIATPYRNYTLWHDHQYRQGMVWESIGYNQPPHASYFLGELEGITVAPPPFTMTGRTEVSNNGTIGQDLNDKHVIVCETGNTNITVADGAKPYMVTFNVPSWVQGTNSTLTNGSGKINYVYYACNVEGAAFTGDMRLVKQGDGILNLPKTDNTYTGETNIWAGTLNFDGTARNSDLWLNRFAEFNSDGGEFHSLKADYGSVIRPGRADHIGQIKVDSTLYLGFGSRVIIDLDGETQTSDCLLAKTLVIETKNWTYGPKYKMPVIELAGNVAAGTYCIAKVENLNGSLTNLKVEGANGLKCSMSYEGGSIYLTLGDVRGAAHIFWTGNVDNSWDYATTENFAIAEGDNLVADVFVQGDIVEFNDDSKIFNIELKDELSLDTFLVNNTTAYTFSGAGKIIAGAFVKEGSGKVTINGDHTYTGGNFLRGGTTIVNSLASNTKAFGSLGAPLTATTKFVLSNGAVLQTTADVQNGSPLRFEGEQGGVIFNNSGFTQQKAVYGTVMTKKGGGSLTFSVANGSLSKLIIAGGSVSSGSTPAASVELQAGTLNLNEGSGTPIHVTGSNTTVRCNADRGSYSNALTGDGRVVITYPLVAGSGWYASRAAMNGNWSAFEGTVVPTTGTAADGRFCLNNSYGIAKGTMEIPSGTIVQNTGKTFAIGNLTGTGKLSGTCALDNNGTSAVNTWNVGNDNDFAFDGVVESNPTFNKVGSGQMTVNGRWSMTGAVNIKQGSVLLTKKLANLGTGKLTIGQEGCLISADDTIRNSSVVVDGLLYPGSYMDDYRGTMYFNGQNVTINAGGTLRVCMRRAGTGTTTLGGSGIRNIGTLTLNGTLLVDLYKSYTAQEGDALRIFVGVANVVGTPKLVCSTPGIVLDGSRLSEGLVIISSIDATSIERMANAADATPQVTYDLRGRRVANDALVSGQIYIRNGRKFVAE
ncbi:MAG: autotransporter-associated beta strand repeat-containing protein, partial [Bacteroidales bacterium]|nr:autotransporter-associated beta strand repeat-containing protein [Bacteroidales bacterium]